MKIQELERLIWECEASTNFLILLDISFHSYAHDYKVCLARDTREGQILEKLFEKIEIMRIHLGSDRVFDVIGDVFEGISLEQLIKDALANKRTLNEILASIESIPDKDLIEIRKATA